MLRRAKKHTVSDPRRPRTHPMGVPPRPRFDQFRHQVADWVQVSAKVGRHLTEFGPSWPISADIRPIAAKRGKQCRGQTWPKLAKSFGSDNVWKDFVDVRQHMAKIGRNWRAFGRCSAPGATVEQFRSSPGPPAVTFSERCIKQLFGNFQVTSLPPPESRKMWLWICC